MDGNEAEGTLSVNFSGARPAVDGTLGPQDARPDEVSSTRQRFGSGRAAELLTLFAARAASVPAHRGVDADLRISSDSVVVARRAPSGIARPPSRSRAARCWPTSPSSRSTTARAAEASCASIPTARNRATTCMRSSKSIDLGRAGKGHLRASHCAGPRRRHRRPHRPTGNPATSAAALARRQAVRDAGRGRPLGIDVNQLVTASKLAAAGGALAHGGEHGDPDRQARCPLRGRERRHPHRDRAGDGGCARDEGRRRHRSPRPQLRPRAGDWRSGKC